MPPVNPTFNIKIKGLSENQKAKGKSQTVATGGKRSALFLFVLIKIEKSSSDLLPPVATVCLLMFAF
jgi:hypothetical protein